MSVYKIKKSPYYQYDFVLEGRRYTGTTGLSDKVKAKAVERRKRAEAALGQDRKSVPTLDEAAGRWFLEKGAALGTADEVERRLAVAVSFVGPTLLINQITGDHIAAAVTRRKAIVYRGKLPAPATVNRDIVDCLRPVFRRASRVWQVPAIADIPWGDLREKEPKAKARSYSPTDIKLLFDALPERWHDMGRFAARYGCRLEELFFAPAALDIEGRRVTLRDRKGDDDHTIPLLAEDVKVLAALKGRAQAAGLTTIWFRELKNGRLKPLAYWGAQKAFGLAMKVAGWREATGAKGIHELRHHVGTQTLRATGNLKSAQRLLGHASIISTMRYAHAVEADVLAALRATADAQEAPSNAPRRLKRRIKSATAVKLSRGRNDDA